MYEKKAPYIWNILFYLLSFWISFKLAMTKAQTHRLTIHSRALCASRSCMYGESCSKKLAMEASSFWFASVVIMVRWRVWDDGAKSELSNSAKQASFSISCWSPLIPGEQGRHFQLVYDQSGYKIQIQEEGLNIE